MLNKSLLTILGIVATIGLLGIIVTETISVPLPLQQQAAGAQSTTGQCASALKNASASLCHNL